MMRPGVAADVRRVQLSDETLREGLTAIMKALLAACPGHVTPYVRRLWREEVEVALELRDPIRKLGRPRKTNRQHGVQLLLPLVFRPLFAPK